ncbi:MAG: carbohydrate ABC transporter permease [Chloroflexota bacterium]
MATVTSNEQNTQPALVQSRAQRKLMQRRRQMFNRAGITFLALSILLIWLMPLAYGGVTSLKTKDQISDVEAPILPAKAESYEWEGEEYEVYIVPQPDGSTQNWALVNKGRQSSEFINPRNPEAGLIEWEGRWRTLERTRVLSPTWENYPEAYTSISFGRLMYNTFFYAIVGMIGAVFSAAIVAYGFARFKFPGRNVLFIVLLSTIILPPQVTLVPTYAFWVNLGLVPSWWPLLLPQFFANAYNVFFLRQYFMTIPPEMEEAAKIDGAGPIRTFWSVILPQSIPALVAISLFHFFFAWNDFFGPLIYLAGAREQVPITVGLTFFNGIYGSQPQLIQAASIMTLIIPIIIFFMAQRYFIQGIVITGNK